MTLSDPRFAAEAILATGKVLVFDDVGCLASWIRENDTPLGTAWVSSFTNQKWMEASTAVFLRTDSVRTPMASGLLALRQGREADSVRAALGGDLLSWDEVRLNRGHGAPPNN